MAGDKTHSLKTQIQMNLTGQKKFTDMSKDFENLSTSAYATVELLREFKRELGSVGNVGTEQLKKQLQSLSDSTLALDSTNFSKSLSNKIMKYLDKADVILVDKGGAEVSQKLEVNMPENFWTKNKQLFKQVVSKSLDNVKLTGKSGKVPEFDMRNVTGQFMNKFKDYVDVLINDDKLFDFYTKDKTGKMVPRQMAPMKISDENMQKVMTSLGAHIGNYLADPNNLKMGTPTPINIGQVQLDYIMRMVEERIAEALRQTTVDYTVAAKVDINALVQSVVTSVEQTLTKSGVGLADVDENRVKQVAKSLQVPIDKALKDIVGRYATTLKEATQSEMSSEGVQKVASKIDTALNKHITNKANEVAGQLSSFDPNMFSVKTKDLHKDVKKSIAASMDASVREFTQAFPKLEGSEFKSVVLRENLKVIQQSIQDLTHKSIKSYLEDFKKSTAKVEVGPDVSVVSYTKQEMEKLQATIVKVTRAMIKKQFDALTAEIKGIKLDAVSLGYKPPQDFTRSFARPSVPRGYESIGAGATSSFGSSAVTSGRGIATPRFGTDLSTRSFLGSIMNTMRYITAGAVIGAPTRAIYTGARSTSDYDYEMAKAKQNILIKDPTMSGVATKRVYEDSVSTGLSTSGTDFDDRVTTESKSLQRYMNGGVDKHIQAISKAYTRSLSDMGRAYHIASRRATDPYEALAMTREVAKIYAAEEDIGIETAAKGLESISAQWGVSMYDMDRYSNMMLKTAMLSNTTVKDLISTQQLSGAAFRGVLPGMDDERAYATSMALSSLFVQSTGRTGKEGGTFWRAILQRPFTGDELSQLENLSGVKGFENLNPYYMEDGVKKQKDFLEVFSDIVETTRRIDDPSRLSLMQDMFPRRHGATAEALSTMIEDMQEDLNLTVERLQATGALDPTKTVADFSFKETLEAYVDNIMSVTDEEISGYIAGLQDTFKLTTQGLQSQWEITSFEIFSDLKSDFSNASTYLTAILRKFEENGHEAAEVIRTFAKVGAALVAQVARGKFKNAMNVKYKKEIYEKNLPYMQHLTNENTSIEQDVRDLEVRRNYYNKEYTALGVREAELSTNGLGDTHEYQRIVAEREMLAKQEQAVASQQSRLLLRRRENEVSLAHLGSGFTLDDEARKRSALAGERGVGDAILNEEINRTSSQLVAESTKLNAIYTKMESVPENALKGLGEQAAATEKNIQGLNKSMHQLLAEKESLGYGFNRLASTPRTEDFALDEFEKRYMTPIDELSGQLNQGKITNEQFREEIRLLGESAGVSGEGINKLQVNVESLNRQLRQGNIDANTYAAGLDNATRNAFGKNTVTGKPLNTNMESGLGLLDKQLPLDNAGTAGFALMSLVKAIPKLALMMAAFDLVGVGMEAVAARGMKNFEIDSLIAGKTEKYISKSVSRSERSWYNPLSLLQTISGVDIGEFYGDTKYYLGKLTGAPTEVSEARDAVFDGKRMGLTDEALEEYILDELGKKGLDPTTISRKAKMEMQEEYLKVIDPFTDRKGNVLEAGDPRLAQIPLEDITEFLNHVISELQNEMSKADYEFNRERYKLLAKGMAEDSAEIRNMLKRKLDLETELIAGTLNELNEKIKLLVPGSLQETEMSLKILELESKLGEVEYQTVQNQFGAFDEYMRKHGVETSFAQARGEIKRNNAILAGVRSGSTASLQLEARMAKEQAGITSTAISKLENLKQSFLDNPEQLEKINLQILQLQAEQTRLLVEIDEKLKGQLSTFNLPSGMEPITYYEAMTRGNTHRNVSVQSGETLVNINIDNMSGSEEDVKRVQRAVEDGVSMVQRNIANDLARNVQQNMGYNYYPINQ